MGNFNKSINIRTKKAVPECPLCGDKFVKVKYKSMAGHLHPMYQCNRCKIMVHQHDPCVGLWDTRVKSVSDNKTGLAQMGMGESMSCTICFEQMNSFTRLDDYVMFKCPKCRMAIATEAQFPFEMYLLIVLAFIKAPSKREYLTTLDEMKRRYIENLNAPISKIITK